MADGRGSDTLLDSFEGGACPQCRECAYIDFRPSTSDEIQKLGFRPGDYE